MPMLLNIQSSPNMVSSASRAVSKAFVDKFVALNSGTEVVDLDLVQDVPSHFGPSHLRAFFTPAEEHAPENIASLEASDAYIDQLIAADVLVLGTPMHNFGISSTMKSWVDNILRAGRTFQYTETGPVGLLSEKKVIIVVGSGGIYTDGPMSACEHCGNYLRDILKVIGLSDITILRAEGLALGPELAEKGLSDGIAAAKTQAQGSRVTADVN